MLYGCEQWELAERRCRPDLLDEEEGIVLLDFDIDEHEPDGRGQITEREVECVEGRRGGDSEKAEEEVRTLLKGAIGEIKAWDPEMGKRMGFVTREMGNLDLFEVRVWAAARM